MTRGAVYINGFAGVAAPPPSGFAPLEDEALRETRVRYSLRRADRFTSLAVMAATAVRAGVTADTALITASAFGPHRTTFATLDDILDFAEDEILPTRFSHSVHNAAASYLGVVLGTRGPTLALTGFESVWFEALELAATLLECGAAPQALVVAVEEKALLTEHAHAFYPEKFPDDFPEGAAALLLTSHAGGNRLGSLAIERSRRRARGIFAFGLAADFWSGLADAGPDTHHVLNVPEIPEAD